MGTFEERSNRYVNKKHNDSAKTHMTADFVCVGHQSSRPWLFKFRSRGQLDLVKFLKKCRLFY